MRLDLQADIETERTWALTKLSLTAKGELECLNAFATDPLHRALAYVQAQEFLQHGGTPGCWVQAEHSAIKLLSEATPAIHEVATQIVANHNEHNAALTAHYTRVRIAELKIQQAKSVAAIHAVLRDYITTQSDKTADSQSGA